MTRKSDLVSLGAVVDAHGTPEGFAAAMSRRAFLVDGQDATGCERTGCENAIEFTEWDEGGPDPIQPQGFKCADHWVCNDCGDRAQRICNECLASGLAV